MKNIDIDVYVVKISDEFFFSVSLHMISTFFFIYFC